MDEHKKFLADRIFSEETPITYRHLSRALNVHVNTAKEMLYDFHRYQNALRGDSVHATYLVYGIKGSVTQGDGDVKMSSSMPENEPISDEVPTATLSLVREEDLEAVLEGYQEVTSIHVYSLASHPQRDLSVLSQCSSRLGEFAKPDNPATEAQKYGAIVNPSMRKRDRKGRPIVPVTAPSQPVKKEPVAKPAPASQPKKEADSTEPKSSARPKQEPTEASSKDSTPSSSAAKKPAPALKRGLSGGIMQSFAKAAAKPPKPKPIAKKEEEDTAMALSDDGEADDSDMPAPKKQPAESESLRRAKKEREEELRRMMEEDDDDDDESDEKEDEPADEEMEDAPEPEPEPEPEAKKEDKEPAEVISSSGDGRRRGRRRVMKKKRILDDQGYMVTIQEPGWESFSEDEAPPPAKKAAPSSTPASSAPKAKKATGKASQGNIMSFFSKK